MRNFYVGLQLQTSAECSNGSCVTGKIWCKLIQDGCSSHPHTQGNVGIL